MLKNNNSIITKNRISLLNILLRIGFLVAVIAVIGYYFRVIVVDNKKEILKILVLSQDVDVEILEETISDIISVGGKERISIKYINPDVEANQAVITTWIRAKSVDLIIGDKPDVDFYAANEFLMEWPDMLVSNLANEEDAYMVYSKPLEGIKTLKNPVMSIPINVENIENAACVANYFQQ